MHKEYSKSSQYNHPPMKLYGLYGLLVAIFSRQTFINEIEKFISFPMEKLILFAASNILNAPHGAEILSRFSINSRPRTILTAIGFGNPDLVRAILNNSQNDLSALMDQRTFGKELLGPMHKAANQGNVEIINLLLERGFPANVERSGGIRPIHLASMWGNYDAAVRLFEFDKDVTSSPQKFGDSPAAIVEAAQNGNIRIVEFFLNQDTVDLANNLETSRRLVEVALDSKNAKLGKLLIDSGKVMLTPDEIESLQSFNFDF